MRFNEEAPTGWKGTIKAALDHHPEKFSKEACKKGSKSGKLCPYAVFRNKDKKGEEPHYKDQKTTLKGKPTKKKKYKNESFANFLKNKNEYLYERINREN